MKDKFLLLLLIFLLPAMLFAELNVYFDCNRFPAENKNTTFEITYKVFDSDLDFSAQNNILTARLIINFKIYNANGESMYNKEFVKQIQVDLNKTSIYEDEFFIDKIIATVTPGTYIFSVSIRDRISKESILWEKTYDTLDLSHMNISDVEISSFHQEDSSEGFMNFKRNNIVFLVNPNHLFNPLQDDGFTYYFEVFNEDSNAILEGSWKLKLKNNDDQIIYSYDESFTSSSPIKSFWEWIPISDLEAGTYMLKIDLYSKNDPLEPIANRTETIFIQPDENTVSDTDVENEYRYAVYFMTNAEEKIYESLDNEGKMEFLKRFWQANDPNPKTEENEYKEEIIRRVNYANRNFSQNDDGWKSDRGRIYIRMGKPEEVIDKAYEFQAKPYIIWKYYMGGKRIYIFVDFTSLGDYKLVYVDNDEFEFSDPNWLDYMGPYFDENELQ
ncbi:MAG TPA: GWxTD domain-containing protein [Candidatus Cloacimonetes bacterium]|nr:GWxTD domain-containing protein [Candidatus Cloacimonadota bacterium]